MSFIKSMQQRYTTKMYDNAKSISHVQKEELKEILRISPSSINSQPWKFSFISDSKTKEKLAQASYFNDEKIKNCDTLVVFSSIDNIPLFEKQIATNLPEGAVGYYNQFLKPQSETKIKSWFDRQVYLALGVFLSACAEMKIDATPMEGIESEKYDVILGQEDYSTLAAVAIGYRDIEDSNQVEITPKSRKAFDDVIKSI